MPQSRPGRLLFSLLCVIVACAVAYNLYYRYLNSALFHAVRTGNVASVRALLKQGADADTHRAFGNRRAELPLLALVISPFRRPDDSDEEIACLLIQNGANIREKPGRGTYLENACRSGSLKTIRCLLEQGDGRYFTGANRSLPIRNAIDFGNDRLIDGSGRLDTEEMKDRRRVSREMVRLLRLRGARLTVHQAVELEDVTELKTRLEAGIPADEQEGNRPTALCVAAGRGHLPILRLLLAHGADVNHLGMTGTTALCYAAENGRREAVQILLDHGAEVNQDGNNESPLEAAVRGRDPEIVRLLLKRGAYPDLRRPDGAPPYALREAILNLPEVVPDLLDHRADVNAAGGEPLMAALESHQPKLVEELLQRGARLHFPSTTQERPDIYVVRRAFLPMMAAVLHSPECKDMLLKAGADINDRDSYGHTALTRAILYAPGEVKYLLEHGAEVNIMTQAQRTPLDLAAAMGDIENARLLVAHGADVNACPPRGHKALYWARKHDRAAVIALLQKAGAKE